MSTQEAAAGDAQLRAAYRDYEGRVLARGLIVANVVGSVGMPGGVVLDYFVYPGRVGAFLAIRLAVDAILLAIVGILFLRRQQIVPTTVKTLAIVSALVINASFCLMIYLTDGALSHYYAALNLIITCWAILLPWRPVQTAITCVVSLAMYAVACVANPTFTTTEAGPLFAYNTFFILITTGVCIAITFFLARARFDDFRLRHQLDEQNRELQDLDRIKTQFFSNVSHELRTPLTLILGPVENMLARGDSLDAKMHESLIFIHRNSLRLLKLINDLLNLTRIDQGAEVPRRKTLRVGLFVKGIVDSIRHLGMSKQLRIRVEDGDPSATMAADPARIEKVLVNLLTNAVKFTPSGGSILVRWKTTVDGTAIEVEDTGVGIPPEDIGRVFDRFHQVRGNATNQQQGVGIGLALARELVQQHGGRIEVQSVPGAGSTFRIVLPVAEADDEVDSPGAEGDADEPFEKAFRSADRAVRNVGEVVEDLPVVGQGRELVLIADDENEMRQFIVGLLADDYRIVQTGEGGSVKALVEEHEPAIVLLDWMMPGRNGLEVCRDLRADSSRRDLKIMLLTARIDEKSKLDALAAGADDFLTKPFSSVEVRTRVANLIRSARLQRDLRGRNDELAATVEKLQRTEAMLIQSEKMNAIGSLSAGLLHEINNPLNYTLTAISLVKRQGDMLNGDMRELVDDIEEGMIRIRDVITNLKGFAYPEKAAHQSIFPLEAAVRDAIKLCSGELVGVRVEVDLPGDLVVSGLKTQLTHLFMNLLGNAAKALGEKPPAGGQPALITVRGSIEDEMATVEVADNGPGLPAEILGRVFEPFFTTRAPGAGMGLGLSICHTIMEAHQGSIRVGNRSEGGAVFTIHIPLATKMVKSC